MLLVDDDTSILDLVGETMASMGHKVITAENGCAALHHLIDNRLIDCLFADVVMAKTMNGIQLVKAARVVRPGLSAMLASAYPREEVRAMGEIPDDVCLISKPYLLSDIHELLYWDGGGATHFHAPPSPTPGCADASQRAGKLPAWRSGGAKTLRVGEASKTVHLGESWMGNGKT